MTADPNAPISRHALVLIDFQHDFLADDGAMPVSRAQVQPMLAAAAEAIAAARVADDPIVAIGNEFRSGDHLMNLLRRRAAIAGSPGARWDERLPLTGIAYLPKWAGSAFINPAFEAWLKERGVGAITVTGLKAGACVTATVKDALARGFKVRVLSQAVACDSDRSRRRALDRLAARGAEVVL